jgi:hypothetical protein
MKTKSKNRVLNLNRIVAVMIAITICFPIVPGFNTKARANEGAAFLGGVLAGHVVGGMVRRSRIRTAAAVHEAYGQPRTVQQAAPAPAPAPAPSSPRGQTNGPAKASGIGQAGRRRIHHAAGVQGQKEGYFRQHMIMGRKTDERRKTMKSRMSIFCSPRCF